MKEVLFKLDVRKIQPLVTVSVLALVAAIHADFLPPQESLPSQGPIVYSDTFSEKDPGTSGFHGIAVSGIECSGSRCGNKRLAMKIGQSLVKLRYSDYFTDMFSEEGDAMGECPPGQLVSEVQCSNDKCDNIRLRCSEVAHGFNYRVSDINTQTGDPFSSVQGLGLCPDSTMLAGIGCSGSFCANIKLICKYVFVSSQLVKDCTP